MTTLDDIEAACRRVGVPVADVNWTYDGDGDSHVPAKKGSEVIMLGLNPGAGNGVAKGLMSSSERTWRTRSARLTGRIPSQIVFAELILRPTLNESVLRVSSGGDLTRDYAAAAEINLLIIAYHRPKIVYQTGIDRPILQLYGLESAGEPVTRPDFPEQRLARPYRMKSDGTPWIMMRHPSARGSSTKDRDRIRECADQMERGR